MRVLLFWLLTAIASQAAAFEVIIDNPRPATPIYGEVEIRVEIYPSETEIDRIEIFFDGRFIDRLEAPPWSTFVDAGQENVGHEIDIAAYDKDGNVVTTSLETRAIPTDEVVDVELRQLYVSVEGEESNFGRRDFSVFDEGKRQRLITFERGEVPFSAVVLLDASSSMRGERLESAISGLRAFVRGMAELDESRVVVFSDRILHETPFTGFASVLEVGVPGVSAEGGTALNDALFVTLKQLERRRGRRVIILLSDGIDVDSVLRMEDVRDVTRLDDVVLYWIRLAPDEPVEAQRSSVWRDEEGHKIELEGLRLGVSESGGRIVTVTQPDQIPVAFTRILDELRSQYVLGYYPPRTGKDGKWHDVDVRIQGVGDRRIRTSRGYFEYLDR